MFLKIPLRAFDVSIIGQRLETNQETHLFSQTENCGAEMLGVVLEIQVHEALRGNNAREMGTS